MWTTKRVLLLLAGFALFFSAYLSYAYFLGGIDGLPPLPQAFWKGDPDEKPLPAQPPPRDTDRKLQMAFGQGWEELLKCSIKMEVTSKNLVLAAKDFVIEPDGRVKLMPFNLAIFGKEADTSKFPEINTVQSEVAYLIFDRPISNITEMGSRKIVAGELSGNIMIKNNRKSLQQDDDLSLSTPGPLYYKEDQNLIWTMSSVRLLDTQSKPEPTTVTANGLDLHLSSDKGPAPTAPKKNQAMSGVDTVQLRSTVEMHLWLDPNSDFLASGKEAPGATAKDAPQEKPKVVITTEGPFVYDVATDRARFDIPQRPGRFAEKVTVTRLTGEVGHEKRDRLDCEHLELQFQRKAEAKGSKDNLKDDRALNLAIQNAHATGREVILDSEGETLRAIGNDFFYDALTRESTLKGTPEMVALKDGHEIHASELRMLNPGKKDTQQARAKGPGKIDMLDRASGKRTMHARWNHELEFGKEGAFDILILTGSAIFEDQQNGQQLKADRLKVWLQPAGKEAAPENKRLRPHHLEATGHVTAHSEDLHVQEPTEHLLVWFKDVSPRGQLPMSTRDAPSPPAPVGDAAHVVGKPDTLEEATPPRPSALQVAEQNALDLASPTAAAAPAPRSPAPAAQAPASAKKPIILSAHTVETFVARVGDKNELDKLWCEGDVKVHQEPASPDDKPVDIRGKTLQLNHSPDGSVLVVTGDLAQVQLNKITILGPEVNIDQKNNKAWVNGTGAMTMLSRTSLGATGEVRETREPSELTVHWNKDMFFNGQYALFHGGIQAEQDKSWLVCQEMQVFLDRPVSFKEGEKGGPPAKVKDLVCDKSVRIEDKTEENGRLTRHTRLTSPGVAMNNEDGRVSASGPGVVHILQLGSAEEVTPGLQPKEKPRPDPSKPKEELKLTRVNYLGKLFADNNKRTATFYESVEVVHLPSDNMDVVVDVDHPPPGCMYLRCEQLKVFSHRQADGRSSQEMEAIKKVVVQSQDFWGVADKVKFDESKELVIFEGGESGQATLYRTKVQGAPPEKLTGKKIFYWRKTNEVKIEGGQGINVQ